MGATGTGHARKEPLCSRCDHHTPRKGKVRGEAIRGVLLVGLEARDKGIKQAQVLQRRQLALTRLRRGRG